MILLKTLLFGVLIGIARCENEKRWCKKEVVGLQNEVSLRKQEKTVNCSDLYKFLQQGWKYDELKMKNFHGSENGGGNQLLCYVFMPSKIRLRNVTSSVLECCNGWTGDNCQHRSEKLGTCYYDEKCPKTTLKNSENQKLGTQRLFSKSTCCTLLGGKSWQSLIEFADLNKTTKSCDACSNIKPLHEDEYPTTCISTSQNNYIKFDGKTLKFSNDCAYRLATAIDGTWWIDIQNQKCKNQENICSKKLRISTQDDVIITLIDDEIYFNPDLIPKQQFYTRQGIIIQRSDRFVTLKSSTGVNVRWDGNFIVIVTLEENLTTASGLCGAHLTDDDWTRDDIIKPVDKKDQNKNVQPLNLSTNRQCLINHPSPKCTKSNLDLATLKCSFILDDNAFTECRQILDPYVYYKICVSSLCEALELNTTTNNSFCDVTMTYMLSCVQRGGNVKDWMEKSGCSWNCPSGMEFTDCSNQCPATCDSNQESNNKFCYENCVPGCQCPSDKVLNPANNKCISVQQCPCKHRSQIYAQGVRVSQDCNSCLCGSRGVWNCSTSPCHGVCHVISARHVITFDDSKFAFDSNEICRHHTFVQTRSNDLLISAEIMTSESIDDVSDLQHIRSVTLKFSETRLKLGRNLKLRINGSEVATPFRNNDVTIRQATTHSWLVKGFGFTLFWTPFTEQITITLEPVFANKVFGLCGTFSWNPHDDFTTLDGAVEQVSNLFVRKFQFTENWDSCSTFAHQTNESNVTGLTNFNDVISRSFTSDPCATHAQRKELAKKLCGILDDEIFKICHNQVDVETYEEACYYDVCRSRDSPAKAACRALSSYAQACLQFNENDSELLGWRSYASLNGQCDIPCPSYLTFNECQPISTSLCSDVTHPLPSYNNRTTITKFEQKSSCLPGCSCPTGQFIATTKAGFGRFETTRSLSVVRGLVERGFEINDETFQCVPTNQCPCTHRGKNYEAENSFKTGCVNCLCKAGKWNCSSQDCGAIVTCPNNLIFSHTVILCDQLTCKNIDRLPIMMERGDCDAEISFEGCKCKPGFILEDNRCILPSDCPCYFSGLIYEKHQTRKQDCNTCTCVGRKWDCTEEKCSAQCIATGDPHFITFDGAKYSFQGTCGYVLSQEINGLFSITSENIPCGFNGVTCTKSVFVTVGSNTVHLLRGKKITVNGVRVARLPRRYGNHDVIKNIDGSNNENGFNNSLINEKNNDGVNNDVTTMAIDTSGIYIIVTWPHIGLSVMWDGGTRVIIQLSSSHLNKVVGLCGNFDHNLVNDFTTRHGSVEMIQTNFADSWKVSPFCSETTSVKNSIFVNPCEANLHRSSWARKKCNVIENGNLFSECRQHVDHVKYYEWCVYDACACNTGGDCECVCTAIAAYAQQCNQNNVPIRWRSQDLCPLQCENGALYMECGPVCQKTCQNKDQLQASYCSILNCVEGCFCPSGTVLHNQHCIPTHDCPCFYQQGEYQVGTLININCRNCSCENGNWNCEGEKCGSLAPSCGENKFFCRSKFQCIPNVWRCDYESDCFDGSDEINCNRTLSECQLVGGHFCDDNNCISIQNRCDGIVHCHDQTDELNCDVIIDHEICDENQFTCQNGKCISNELVCDGHYNCGFGDFSDENNCAEDCPILTHVSCHINNTCILRSNYCDGISHCPNNYDETNCNCDVTYFTCASLQCVERRSVCNGIWDCEQGEDEMNCDAVITQTTPSINILTTASTINNTNNSDCPQFKCESESPKCLLWSQLCDDVIDCIDQSDETEFCWQGCQVDEFSCDGGTKCLQMDQLCDGNPVCQDKSDENIEICENFNSTHFECEGFKCSDGVCIHGSMVCDGVAHCDDNEDEIGCQHYVTTPTPQVLPITTIAPMQTCNGFTCLTGQCISLERICNGVDECFDGNAETKMMSSDEVNCSTWNSWSNWGDCSHNCGSGIQTRIRSCTSPGGQNTNVDVLRFKCVGKSKSSKPCFKRSCKNDTVLLTKWSTWSHCSALCGGGLTYRSRSCSDKICSTLSPSGRNNLGPPIMEIKSCAEFLCPDKSCSGNKIHQDCDLNNRTKNICPLTCHDIIRGGGTSCVAQSKDGDCVTGCFCPSGHVALNKSSDFCVKENECPCYEGEKIYQIGEEVSRLANCEKCQCMGAGKWGNCVADPNCEPPACGWTPWSNWGPCFGPCGINGVQWAFRSPLRPSRYGSKNQCQGLYRKSRRCPTQQCQYCDVIGGKQRIVGDQWKMERCQICSCLENQTIQCRRYCEYAVTGCPNNQTLIKPENNSQCCYCTLQDTETTPVIHDITTPAFIQEIFTQKSTLSTTTKANMKFNKQTTIGWDNRPTTEPTTIYTTTPYQDSNPKPTVPSFENGSGESPKCKDDEFQCKTSTECISNSFICDGISNCVDQSDETLQQCQTMYQPCQFNTWTSWSACSKSCGLGKQMKHRGLVEKSKNKNQCNGPFQLFRACYEKSCKRDGAWSPWKPWSQCSRTCGGGVQSRKRSCDSPQPLNGGRECPGVCSETKVCNAIPCMPGLCTGGRIFLNGTECLNFRACSQTCADLSANVRCRTECSLRGNLGGCFCPPGKFLQDGVCVELKDCRCTVSYNEYEPQSKFQVNNCHCTCNNGRTMCNNCSVDCGWSTWSPWSQCDRTCGSLGHAYRFRSPNNPPSSGQNAHECLGDSRQQKACSGVITSRECPPMWGEWQSWGDCSTSCGVGRRERVRACKIDDVEVSPSFCTSTKQHYNLFRQNRKCSSSNQTLCSICSAGMEYKCKNCPQTCDSLNNDNFIGEKCNKDCVWGCHCPEGKYLSNRKCVDISNCSCDISKYNLNNNLETLGPGQSVVIGCKNCTCRNVQTICTNHTLCESNVALWEWSNWSKWSPCSHSCINIDMIAFEQIGIKQRNRKCLSKNINFLGHNSENCQGVSQQFTQCGLTLCFEGSTWNNWQPWSQCDKSCNGGIQSRHRSCKEDQFNMKNCKGESVMVQPCNLQPCFEETCPKNSQFVKGCRSCNVGKTCLELSSEITNSKLCQNNNNNNTINNCEVGHCACTNATFWQNGQCVPQNECNCYALGQIRKNRENFNIGQCTTCQCNGGTINCGPKKFLNGSNVCEATNGCFGSDYNWSIWSKCSKKCGVGIRRRFSLFPTTASKYVDTWCQKRVMEQEDCNIFNCDSKSENCSGESCTNQTRTNNDIWSNWGQCSLTCIRNNFNSWRHRYKLCENISNCSKPDTETELCDNSILPECENRSLTKWSSWSSCSFTCSTFQSGLIPFKTRTRICMDQYNNVIFNKENTMERKECDKGELMPCSNWTKPTNNNGCTKIVSGSTYQECGPRCVQLCGGLKQCFNTCSSGCYCNNDQVLNNNHTACISSTQCQCVNPFNGEFIENGKSFSGLHQLCKCINGSVSCRDKEIKGNWCSWSHWTTCTRLCGHQERFRIRSCGCPSPSDPTNTNLTCKNNHNNNNITNNNKLQTQTELCRIYPSCNKSDDNKDWTIWSIWSSCSSSCVGGTQWRKRVCQHEPCVGSIEQTRPCNSNISCTTTNWEKWSGCSLTCGLGGIRIRSRSCLSNHVCLQRDLAQFSACQNIRPVCPTTLTSWSIWSTCSKSCDKGIQYRSRNCKNDTKFFSLENCFSQNLNKNIKILENFNNYLSQENQTRTCIGKKCHNLVPNKQPDWSEWSLWSVCTGSCGNSKQTRFRECELNGNAGNNNVTCKGAGKIDRPCKSLFCSNGTQKFCPQGLFKVRACDICAKETDENLNYRLPLTCDEIAKGDSLKCNQSDCSEICVCPENKVTQNDICMSAHECECMDEHGRLFIGNTAWNTTTHDQYGRKCRSECSCLIGRIVCEPAKCDESDCDVTDWGSWTPCNSSCYDSAHPSTRYRFRSLRFEPVTSETNCSENLMEIENCEHLKSCVDSKCQDNEFIKKIWKPNECVTCSCNENQSKSCLNTCKNSPHCTDDVICPEVTCRNGEERKRNNGDCCSTCQKVEREFSCELTTELRNFSLDGCRSRDVEVKYCVGGCQSSVNVLPYEPFIKTECECCKHKLNVSQPYISVQLYCLDDSNFTVELPNIANCHCEKCGGTSNLLKSDEP